VSGSISVSGSFIMTVDTAHATEATTAVHTPKASRSGCAASERTLTISAIPPSVRSEPTMTGSVSGSSRNAAASRAAPTG
jgi:hypothetical protein